MSSFLLLSLTTLGLVAGVAYRSARDSLRDEVDEQLNSVSELKAEELGRWVREQTQTLELVAALPEVTTASDPTSPDPATLDTIAALVRRDGVSLSEVFFLSGQGGRVLASTTPGHVGDYHTTDLFFEEGRSRTHVGGVYPHPTTARPTLTVAVPIRTEEGQTVALVAAHLNLERMDLIVSTELGTRSSSEAYLVTPTKDFVSSETFGRPAFRRGVDTDGINAAVAGHVGLDLYDNYAGVPVIGAYRWLPELELALLVEVSRREAFDPARDLLRFMVLTGLGATFLLAWGVRRLARTMARPLHGLSQAAARVAGGDFDVAVPVGREDEVGALARSFNIMTDHLRTLYLDLQGQIEVSTRTLQALRENKHLLQSIVDNSTALIAVATPEGQLAVANRALERVLGLEPGEAIGHTLSDFLPYEIAAGCSSAREAAARRGKPVEREIQFPSPGGVRTYLFTWFPLGDEDGGTSGTGMIATDLTERQRAEEDRASFEAQMRHFQKLESLGVLAGGIAHDFNNILAAILGHAELAKADENPASRADSLGQVVEAAHRGAELTNQMLAYAGRASLRVETVDLNQALGTIAELVAVSLPKTVQLRADLCPEPLPVQADPSQISQVLMNLVSNAGQAIGDRPGAVTVTTGIASVGSRSVARLTVGDTGCGMTDAVRDRIFDPFFSTKETGHGLGLAAVAGIVSGLGGDITVDTELGRGTTFQVRLPLSRKAAKAGPPPGPQEEAAADDLGGRLLVVDDEAPVRSLTRRVLERAGFDVMEAEDGATGLQLFLQHHHRLRGVILDLSMPGMSGDEVFRQIRDFDAEVPVVVISGYDPADAAQRLQTADFVSILQKPFRPVALTEAVVSLLSGAPVIRA